MNFIEPNTIKKAGQLAAQQDPAENNQFQFADSRCKKLSVKIVSKMNSIVPASGDCLNKTNIDNAWTNTIYNPDRNKFVSINNIGDLSFFGDTEFRKDFCTEMHGAFIDYKKLRPIILEFYKNKGDDVSNNFEKVNKMMGLINTTVKHTFFLEFKIFRQRNSFIYDTDMFGVKTQFLMEQDAARLVLIHTPFRVPKSCHDLECERDYLEHFPEEPVFLNLLVASRFASDRKKAFFWMQAVSDWGKGFFTSILKELGILTEITLSEIEKAIAGDPVGIRATDFKGSWILWIDEFDRVKKELKNISSSIMFSSKGQMRSVVPLYLKLFTSAEGVDSLVGAHGVEEQFSNRFSMIKTSLFSIENREVFKKKGRSHYLNAVKFYIADQLKQ